MALRMAALSPPVFLPIEVRRLEEAMDWLGEGYDIAVLDFPYLRGRGGRQMMAHSWAYSLLAAPAVRVAHAVGAHPGWGFTATNLGLLSVAALLAARVLTPGWFLILFGGPVVWWIDKAHPEVFLFSLLSIAIVSAVSRPGLAIVALAATAAQNPAFVPLFVVGLAIIVFARALRGGVKALPLGATVAGIVIAAAPFLHSFWQLGTWTPLSTTTIRGAPGVERLSAVLVDPNIGVLPGAPALALGLFVTLALAGRRGARRAGAGQRESSWPSACLAVACATWLVVASALPANLNHGATPGMSRYGLWLMPAVIPLASLVLRTVSPVPPALLAVVGILGCVWSGVMFRPSLPESYRYPSVLADWLWTHYPSSINPIPEIFAERTSHQEPAVVPAATTGCEKVLTYEGRWPLHCLPRDTMPSTCLGANVFCYANRTAAGATYVDLQVEPTWQPVVSSESWDSSLPIVRGLARDIDASLTVVTGALSMVRGVEGVASAVSWEGDGRLVVYVTGTGDGAHLRVRVPVPMRTTMRDLESGAHLADLDVDPAPAEPFVITLPAGVRHLLVDARAR